MLIRPPVGRDPSGFEGVNLVDIAFFRLSPLYAVSNLADSECPRYTTPYPSFPVRSVVISPHLSGSEVLFRIFHDALSTHDPNRIHAIGTSNDVMAQGTFPISLVS